MDVSASSPPSSPRTDHPPATANPEDEPGTPAQQTAGAPAAPPQLDMSVGAYRARWPLNVTAIVSVAPNVVVRYHRNEKALDLVEFVDAPPDVADKKRKKTEKKKSPQRGTGGQSEAGDETDVTEDPESELSAKVLYTRSLSGQKLNAFASLHAFTQRGELRMLCVDQSGKSFSVFGIDLALARAQRANDDASSASPSRRGAGSVAGGDDPASEAGSVGGGSHAVFPLLKTGTFPSKASHVLTFQYRGGQYLLAYNTESGEYWVASLLSLGNSDDSTSGSAHASVISRGQFAPGWTTVVWKGTHHTRCTRQKFFCYNAETGESLFECVYVRHTSATSSLVSREHMQMAADGKKPDGEKSNPTEVEVVMRRRDCVVVPLSLRGFTACLLYSHSALKHDPNAAPQSTSRLPGSPRSNPRGETFHVAQNAALLMHKTIFAHSEPWSHFCLLRDQGVDGGGSDLLLCYSASSGTVWVSRLFAAAESGAQKEITLFKETKRDKDTPVQLTKKTLDALAHRPLDVAAFAADQPPPPPPESASEATESAAADLSERDDGASEAAAEDDTSARTPRPPAGKKRAANNKGAAQYRKQRLSPGADGRPSTSSTSLEERLQAVQRRRRAHPGDSAHDEMSSIIRQLHQSDFPPESELEKDALRRLAERSGEGDDNGEGDGSASETNSPTRRAKPGWVSVMGQRGIAPPPPTAPSPRFDRKWSRHLEKDVPKMHLSAKKLDRLSTQTKTREDFQKKEFYRLDKERDKETIGNKHTGDGKVVGAMVRRLGEQDLETRQVKRGKLEKKYIFTVADGKKLDAEEVEELVRHVSDDAVAQHNARMKKLHDNVDKQAGLTFHPQIDPKSAKLRAKSREASPSPERTEAEPVAQKA